MDYATFPPQVHTLAVRHNISPALAFGLGEGLNLYYRRQFDVVPPHLIHVLPPAFEAKAIERLAQPRDEAIVQALAGNAFGVMVCTGDWHGIDAIEKWGEELPFWDNSEGWEESVRAAASLIRQSDGLYRRAYAHFLKEALPRHADAAHLGALVSEIADEWLEIGAHLSGGAALERVGVRVLRMAARESRFWGMILDRFQ